MLRELRDGSGIKCECKLEDESIGKMLSKRARLFGLSIAGGVERDVVCEDCGSKIPPKGEQKCLHCGSSNILIRKDSGFKVKEISLCTDPAWDKSKVESYREELSEQFPPPKWVRHDEDDDQPPYGERIKKT